MSAPQNAPPLPDLPSPWTVLPEVDLRQLRRMTDGTGLIQHALYAVPDPNHGYCTDDNARALIAAVLHAKLFGYDEEVVPTSRYLAFVAYAYNDAAGGFRNFMSYDRQWLEAIGSEDSQGRALWALGMTVQHAPTSGIRDLAGDLFRNALPGVAKLGHIRSWAFVLLGLDSYLRYEPAYASARVLRDEFARRLYAAFTAHATDDWPWWEDLVTYDNAKLCQALFLSGRAMKRPDMQRDATRALSWLIRQQTATGPEGENWLSIIGNDGWLRPGQSRAKFDQQPLEAHALTEACLCMAEHADSSSKTSEWLDLAWWSFEWFLGRNDQRQPLADPDTGGCKDGLQADGPNRNQGAESILAYLLTTLQLSLYARNHIPA